MKDAMQAGTITIEGAGGDGIPAHLAHPMEESSIGSVVVIHHMPGYDEGSKEITRRFATLGYAAICPNLHHREAPGADPDDAAAASRAAGGVPDDRFLGDVQGALDHLRGRSGSNGRSARSASARVVGSRYWRPAASPSTRPLTATERSSSVHRRGPPAPGRPALRRAGRSACPAARVCSATRTSTRHRSTSTSWRSC